MAASLLLAQACTRRTLRAHLQLHQRGIATLTLRAGRHRRPFLPSAAPAASASVSGSSGLSSVPRTSLLLHRSFWKKKPEISTDEAAIEATAAADQAAQEAAEAVDSAREAEDAAAAQRMTAQQAAQQAAPQAAQQTSQQQVSQSPAVASVLEPATPPISESKSERLGFSGVSDALASANMSWARIKSYGVYVVVGAGVLAVFKLGLNMIDFMSSISFLDVGEAAFVGGLITGLGVAGCGVLGSRWLRLRPEPCFKHALRRITTDPTVAAYMGQQVKTSDFRAYNFVDSSLRLAAEQRAAAANKPGIYKWYQPKRLQIMFQVVGSNGVTGMASAEIEKNWRGDHSYNLLSVDLIDGRGSSAAERIILEGDPSYRIYKGTVKLR